MASVFVQDHINIFLKHLRAETGASRHTIDAYRRDLEGFSGFLAGKGRPEVPGFSADDVLAFLMHERSRGLRPSSVGRAFVSIRCLVRHLAAEGLLEESILDNLDAPRVWERLPEVLSPKEVEALLATPDVKTPLGLRNRALLEVLYATGARASETVDLTLDALDLDLGYARVVGKRRKERIVPLGRKAIGAVRRYLNETRDRLLRGRESSLLFLTRLGAPLRREDLWRIVKHCARVAGIRRKVSPHTLRHSFATHLLTGGAGIRHVQEMLGHASVRTTQIYTHVEADRLRSVHRRYHPRA